ncbi:hypothetical protein PENTCL1PPCAC_23710, partial [Pristionchus entomophagus]
SLDNYYEFNRVIIRSDPPQDNLNNDLPPDNYYEFNRVIIRSDPPQDNMNNDLPPENYYEFNRVIIRSDPPQDNMNDMQPDNFWEVAKRCLIPSDPPRTKALADKELIRDCPHGGPQFCTFCYEISTGEIGSNLSSDDLSLSTNKAMSSSAKKPPTTAGNRKESSRGSKRTRQTKIKEVSQREQHTVTVPNPYRYGVDTRSAASGPPFRVALGYPTSHAYHDTNQVWTDGTVPGPPASSISQTPQGVSRPSVRSNAPRAPFLGQIGDPGTDFTGRCIGRATGASKNATALHGNTSLTEEQPGQAIKVGPDGLPVSRSYRFKPTKVKRTAGYKKARIVNNVAVKKNRVKEGVRKPQIHARALLLQKYFEVNGIPLPDPTLFDFPAGFGMVEYVPTPNEREKMGLPRD